MYDLRLLGGVSLHGSSGALSGRTVQRRQLALLAALAAGPDGTLSRDKLVALLWPDHGTEDARHLLADALYVVRKELGKNAILSTGDDLRLNGEVVWTDVRAFRAAIRRGDSERALELYRGPFLDAFHADQGRPFEEWLHGEQERLRAEAARAAWTLVTEHETRGHVREAVRWARHALTIDPFDEQGVRRLLGLLGAAGDRAAAVRAYREFARRLEEELGLEPSRETRDELEAVREAAADGGRGRRGGAVPSRDAPPGRALDEVEAPAAGPDTPGPARGTGPDPRAGLGGGGRSAVVAAAMVALVAASLVGLRWATSAPEDGEAAPSVAVLPFENLSGLPEDEYFASGVAHEIITRLSRATDLRVVSRTSVRPYDESGVPLPEIARELGAEAVLEGGVQRFGDRVRVTVQLIDAGTDRHLWAETYDNPLEDLFGIQSDVARRVAAALQAELMPGHAALLDRRPTEDPEAYNLYLRGRHLMANRWVRSEMERAVEYLTQATERDPSFGLAHVALANTYTHLGITGAWEAERAFALANAAAAKAVDVDEEMAEAYTSAWAVHYMARDWDRIVSLHRRAIDLDPRYALARHCLALGLINGFGRLEEALDQERTAERYDPLAPLFTQTQGWILYLRRDFEGALEQYRKTIDVQPRFPNVYGQIARAHVGLGDLEAAAEAIATGLANSPEQAPQLRAELAAVHAFAGRAEDARRELEAAKAARSRPLPVALAHAALGEREAAYRWIDSTLVWLGEAWVFQKENAVHALRWDPYLDPLRSQPPFRERMEALQELWRYEPSGEPLAALGES